MSSLSKHQVNSFERDKSVAFFVFNFSVSKIRVNEKIR